MTVWVRHLELSEQQEKELAQTDHITLPLDGLPDLTLIREPSAMQHVLKALHPKAPPESLQRLQQRYWHISHDIAVDDVIAVPLKHQNKVVLAEVVGGYRYHMNEAREDIHTVAVRWVKKSIPMRKLMVHKVALSGGELPMFEVTDSKLKAVINSAMPYGYNRFAAIKWIIGVFIAWRLFTFLSQRSGF